MLAVWISRQLDELGRSSIFLRNLHSVAFGFMRTTHRRLKDNDWNIRLIQFDSIHCNIYNVEYAVNLYILYSNKPKHYLPKIVSYENTHLNDLVHVLRGIDQSLMWCNYPKFILYFVRTQYICKHCGAHNTDIF